MNYSEFRRKSAKAINEFQGIFYAFSNQQFFEGMAKIGLKKEDTDKICSIGSGGYILKDRADEFQKIFDDLNKEEEELMKNRDFLKSAFVYELNNHEFGYTGDYEQTLDCLDLKYESLTTDQLEILKEATKIVMSQEY